VEGLHHNSLDIGTQAGLIRPRDRDNGGLATLAITCLVRRSSMQRRGRRLCAILDRPVSETGAASEIACAHPQTFACLLSALQLHDLNTRSPFEVRTAIPDTVSDPEIDYPPLRKVRFSGAALTDGIEELQNDSVPARVTCFARNVVDCFKFHHKIGLDAAFCPVANVMPPYMESLS